MLPNKEAGGRTNIRDYGRRFGYRHGYKEKEDFLISVSQFGIGFITICMSGQLEKGRQMRESFKPFSRPDVESGLPDPCGGAWKIREELLRRGVRAARMAGAQPT
jgi:hypothetical protein